VVGPTSKKERAKKGVEGVKGSWVMNIIKRFCGDHSFIKRDQEPEERVGKTSDEGS